MGCNPKKQQEKLNKLEKLDIDKMMISGLFGELFNSVFYVFDFPNKNKLELLTKKLFGCFYA